MMVCAIADIDGMCSIRMRVSSVSRAGRIHDTDRSVSLIRRGRSLPVGSCYANRNYGRPWERGQSRTLHGHCRTAPCGGTAPRTTSPDELSWEQTLGTLHPLTSLWISQRKSRPLSRDLDM